MNDRDLGERLRSADSEVPTLPICLWSPESLAHRIRQRRMKRAGLLITTIALISLLLALPTGDAQGPAPEPPMDLIAPSPESDRAVTAFVQDRLRRLRSEFRAADAGVDPDSLRGREALARSRAQALLQARIFQDEFDDPRAAARHRALAARYPNK